MYLCLAYSQFTYRMGNINNEQSHNHKCEVNADKVKNKADDIIFKNIDNVCVALYLKTKEGNREEKNIGR